MIELQMKKPFFMGRKKWLLVLEYIEQIKTEKELLCERLQTQDEQLYTALKATQEAQRDLRRLKSYTQKGFNVRCYKSNSHYAK